MTDYGILVDYRWCSGCRACEIACQMEQGLPPQRSGVKVFEAGPWQIAGERWQHDYAPDFLDECDLCAKRTSRGKLPSCVQHCQAEILEFGRIEELSARMSGKKKQILIIP
ncbi:MAG: hypothetical protein LBP28_00525 [Coriobacteriales bacterium]|jgi:anaerobic dimethyl sulfoxide reductase subunit B (iron-sulfur subunit)|nr:hypothetical protein [Coriobacteriales bacterium]